MRRILIALFSLFLITACARYKTSPTSSTGSESEAMEPKVETSFEYGKKDAMVMSKPASYVSSRITTAVALNGNTYSVVETSGGFAVLKLDPMTQTVLERADYTNMDPSIHSLSNPRMGSTTNSSFKLTLREIKDSGASRIAFTVWTSPLRVVRD